MDVENKIGIFKSAGFESLGSETIVHLENGPIRISAVWHRPGPEENRKIMESSEEISVNIDDKDIRLFDSEGNAVNLG